MISHRNVIANVVQITTFDEYFRKSLAPPGHDTYLDNALALLPMSHIYSLVVMCHTGPYRGDACIVLPKFEMTSYLNAIQNFKINSLYIVPPIIILMTKNKAILDKFDLSSVKIVFTGAAPLGKETAEELGEQYPTWMIRQGYGLTETSTVVTSTSGHDIWFGSSGSIIPMIKCRLVDPESGKDITTYDSPGELWVDGPAVTLGYKNNDKANAETYVTDSQGRWMRTGDEAVIRKAPSGNEHLFITDRIKELIKVKVGFCHEPAQHWNIANIAQGLQVAPAELESHLLNHEYVADCAVIPVPDDAAGEVPKAYVVKSSSIGLEESDIMVKRAILKHVEKEKSRHKWLKGGVEFIDVIPKSASGKILRRLLRDKEREARKAKGPKL
jgi:acyl-CoA synthetase (AMP-forming)/AMP-acid ligase II